MKNLLIAAVALALLPAPVFAGGGTKNATQLQVTNNSNGTVAVLIDNNVTTNAQLINLSNAQFRARGGFFLNAGESATINLRAGNHRIRAAVLNATTNRVEAAGRIGTVNVNVRQNQTTRVAIDGTAATTAVLTVQ